MRLFFCFFLKKHTHETIWISVFMRWCQGLRQRVSNHPGSEEGRSSAPHSSNNVKSITLSDLVKHPKSEVLHKRQYCRGKKTNQDLKMKVQEEKPQWSQEINGSFLQFYVTLIPIWFHLIMPSNYNLGVKKWLNHIKKPPLSKVMDTATGPEGNNYNAVNHITD